MAGDTATRRRRLRPRAWSTATLCSLSLVAGCVRADDAAARPMPRPHRRLVDPLETVDATGILQQIGQVDCPETVAQSIRTFLDVNKPILDACTSETGYTLYPYGTKLPDAEQTLKICSNPNCLDLFSGVVLAKLPECEYQRYSPRSFAESFLRVREDLMNERRPPNATEFGHLYALSRVINYLTENTTIQASVQTTFKVADAAARLTAVKVRPDVVLTEGMAVMVNSTASESEGSLEGNGSVHPGAPTVPPTTTARGNSNTTGLTTTEAIVSERKLPENLQLAYSIVGGIWLMINALYIWAMMRKGSDTY